MKANCMCLMIIQRSMSDPIHGDIPKCDSAKRSLDAMRQKFKESSKA